MTLLFLSSAYEYTVQHTPNFYKALGGEGWVFETHWQLAWKNTGSKEYSKNCYHLKTAGKFSCG